GAATNNVELAAHQSERPAHPRLPSTSPCPGSTILPTGADAVSCRDNGFSYVKNRSLRELLASRGIRHLTTEPYRPRTNGKVERFHQTMAREWAYGLAYRTHRHRNTALPHWLNNYNRRRPHSSIGDRPPISRVHNIRG
ncbi:MAG TPA: integrase core domain-containing protein, partial [Gaiellaceae bacterium]|nr:integrase core domain-containing protein [Gaiellaceae bacterium]